MKYVTIPIAIDPITTRKVYGSSVFAAGNDRELISWYMVSLLARCEIQSLP